jgi:FMN-dependent NADH-azoreductase
MTNALLLLSSPRGLQSHSSQIAKKILDDWNASHTNAKVVVRDVAADPLPHVGPEFIAAQALAPERRSPAQRRALETSDELINELAAADLLVLAVPMHNFSLPSSLKAWIDHVVRAGRTFAYSQDGPRGLLTGKKAIVVVARGGIYSEGPAKAFDFQESYLRSILAFIGIADVQVVRVEGVAMGPDAAKNAPKAAHQHAEELVREIA